MKHIFVVNPCAGKQDSGDEIAAAIDTAGVEAEIYETRGPRDATRYVATWCRNHRGEAVRFHACGGDGTLNEVISGVLEASAEGNATDNAEVSCYPCGSGNDFVKYFGKADFTDVAMLVAARPVEVDAMRVTTAEGTRYCINTLNFGFEAEVCRTMADVRRKPLIGGRMAYTTGIVYGLATGMKNPCRMTVDGEVWHEGDLLLAGVANGMFDGGGYRCAPRAVVDDGQLEVMAIGPMSIPRFAKMIGSYERGTHLDDPRLSDVLHYRRGKSVTIESSKPFYIATDGELLSGTRFDVECLPRAVRFAVPGTYGTRSDNDHSTSH